MKENIKLLKTQMVTVGTERIPVKFTFRSMIDFENMTGKSIQNATSTEDVTKLFYCLAKAGAKDTKLPFNLTFEEFLDEIDSHPESIVSFYEAITDKDSEEKK